MKHNTNDYGKLGMAIAEFANNLLPGYYISLSLSLNCNPAANGHDSSNYAIVGFYTYKDPLHPEVGEMEHLGSVFQDDESISVFIDRIRLYGEEKNLFKE